MWITKMKQVLSATPKSKQVLSATPKWKGFFLDVLFPRFCFGCQKEGSYLCEDCQATLEISEYQYCLCPKPQIILNMSCQKCRSKNLKGVFSAVSYQKNLAQKLIQRFKYEPYVKELAKPLASLIAAHFQLLSPTPDFFYPVSPPPKFGGGSNGADFILVPVPLDKKKLKRRGFNQSEEIAKELSGYLKIPLISDVLIKTKETLAQVSLTEEERMKNISGVFLCQNQEKIQGRRILLVDDVYTTGATMEECSRVLRNAGAKEVWGITVARG